MAIGHISIRVHTRSKGHSAAAGIAYRMGVDLVDPRTGVEHLYARRTTYGDIVDCGMAGAGAFADVAALAAAIEAAEKRRNSSLMRDVQVALPCELDEDQCTSLTAEFAALLAQRYRTHTAWSVHRPDKRGDARNQHGHIVVPTRELDNGVFGRKLRVLDDHKTGRFEVAEIRQLWERTANTHLTRAGHAARVDVSRREDGNPVPTLGRGCTAIERAAAVERGELVENRSVENLVATGSAVTWRGRALRRHQLRESQKARQEVRAQSTAPEDEVATIAVTEAQAQAQAAPIRVSLGAPSRSRQAGGRRPARAAAVATPARIDLKQREASGRRALRVHAVQAHTVAEPEAPSTPAARRLEGAAVREARVRAVATPARIDLQPTSLGRGAERSSVPIAARVRQEPAATPARPPARTRTVSAPVELRRAQPVVVVAPVRWGTKSKPASGSQAMPRQVQARPRATPQEIEPAALEAPPSIDEMATELREQHPDIHDWGAVQQRTRGKLQHEVVRRAYTQAQAEGRPVYYTAPSVLDRVAEWIRERVDAALQLLGLRRSAAAAGHAGADKDLDEVRRELSRQESAICRVPGGEDRLCAEEERIRAGANRPLSLEERQAVVEAADAWVLQGVQACVERVIAAARTEFKFVPPVHVWREAGRALRNEYNPDTRAGRLVSILETLPEETGDGPTDEERTLRAALEEQRRAEAEERHQKALEKYRRDLQVWKDSGSLFRSRGWPKPKKPPQPEPVPVSQEQVEKFGQELNYRMTSFVRGWIEQMFDLRERARPLRQGEGAPAAPSVPTRVSRRPRPGRDDDYRSSR